MSRPAKSVNSVWAVYAVLLTIVFFYYIMFFKDMQVIDRRDIIFSLITPILIPLTIGIFFEIRDRVRRSYISDEIANNVEQKVYGRLSQMGSIYFSGVVKDYYYDRIFNHIPKPDDLLESHEKNSKILFIGISTQMIPDWLIIDIRNDAETKRGIKYQILLSFNDEIIGARVNSIFKTTGSYNNDQGYQKENRDNLKEFKEDIRQEGLDICEFKEHSVYPFGLCLIHRDRIWYMPLWNHKDAKNDNTAIELIRDSKFGSEIESCFDSIWDRSQALQA